MMLAAMDAIRTITKLISDSVTFFWLFLRPPGTLAAENLFLRKQLTLYQERKQKPRRPVEKFQVLDILQAPPYPSFTELNILNLKHDPSSTPFELNKVLRRTGSIPSRLC